MLLPLTLSISTVRNWGVARVVFHAKSENTNPLDLMHCDRRRAMIKSQTDQAFREYAMAFKCCTLDWTPTYYRQAAPHMLIKEYKYTHKLQDLPTKPSESILCMQDLEALCDPGGLRSGLRASRILSGGL